ncbi:MAG: hypothetical protein SH859_16110 [Hyphomicrobium aestuarii]|nr:hypothetical protein [Hyphomicrobium aestuarii]
MIRIAVLTAVAALAMTSTAQAGKCVVTTATGIGATKEIAEDLAKMSLASAISASGNKASGKVSVKNEGAFPLITSKASQRNCK